MSRPKLAGGWRLASAFVRGDTTAGWDDWAEAVSICGADIAGEGRVGGVFGHAV